MVVAVGEDSKIRSHVLTEHWPCGRMGRPLAASSS